MYILRGGDKDEKCHIVSNIHVAEDTESGMERLFNQIFNEGFDGSQLLVSAQKLEFALTF
jgi:hypothetical protein